MRTGWARVWVWALLCGGPVVATPAYAGAKAEASAPVSLDVLAEMMGRKLKRKEVKKLQSWVDDEREPVRAVVLALLTANDPEPWLEAFATIFTVTGSMEDDDAQQVTTVEVTATMREIFKTRPNDPPELQSLLTFLQYRDANMWLENPTGPISVAKFWRSNFLTFAWAEAEARGRVSRMAILQKIDADQ